MNISLIFFLFSAVFIFLSLVDYVKKGPQMTPARKTWMIIGVVFSLVAVVNLVV